MYAARNLAMCGSHQPSTFRAAARHGRTARLVARGRTERADNQARDEVQAACAPAADAVAKASGHLGNFPSGHAMETTGVALASAYVLAREGIVPAAPAFAVAALAAAASGAAYETMQA